MLEQAAQIDQQMRLLAQCPGDSVRDVRLSAPVGPYYRSNAFARKLQFRTITEGFKPEDLYFLQLEQLPTPSEGQIRQR